MHTYTTSIRIHASVESVFAFHTDPANLLRITPRTIRVDILRFDAAGEGAMVELRIRPLPLIFTRWLMRFDVFEPPYRLSDVQVRGPFRHWRQLREFIPDGDEYCLLRDTVEYALPFGIFGRILNRALVARQIRGMFAYRQEKTRETVESAERRA
ncbi:MAG: SRPBCC family protein [Bacteroidia bacterium]|nr:SRPBCC family protein [Bacteroidia bacterium]